MEENLSYKLNSEVEKEAFDILYELKDRSEVNAHTVNDAVVKLYDGEMRGKERTIVYSGVEYSCGSSRQRSEEKKAQSYLTDNGFSWFSALREDEEDEKTVGAKKWQMLLTKVPQSFFSRYPILVYDARTEEIKDDNKFRKCLTNLMETAFDVDESRIKIEQVGMTKRTFYGASLRLDLSTGGEPFSVVGRIIFAQGEPTDKGETRFDALPADQAKNLTSDIEFGQEGGGEIVNLEEGALTGFRDNGIKKFLNELGETGDLNEYLVFSAQDKKIIEGYIKEGTGVKENGKLKFDCLKIEVKLYMKISVNVPQYIIRLKCGTGEKVLSASSFEQLITLVCDCGAMLIKDNRVCTSEAQIGISFDNNGKIKFVAVGPDMNGDKAKKLAKKLVFDNHLYHIACRLMHREKGKGDECDAYVCNNSYIDVLYANGLTEHKCVNCPYWEIYKEIDGKCYDVSMLRFDGNELFVKGRRESRCEICHRPIKGEVATKCALCDNLRHGNGKKNRYLYKKYRILLPLMTRLKYFGVKNTCVEDQEYIVFELKTKRKKAHYEVYDKIKGDWVDLTKPMVAEESIDFDF